MKWVMFRDRQGNLDAMTIAAFGLASLAALTIIGMIGAAVVAMYFRPDHAFDAQGLGVGIAAVLTGLATFATAYAVYWRFDGTNAKAMAEAKSNGAA